MAAFNSYKHEPLDLQKSQIRLFRLLSKHDGILEGEVSTQDFEDGPSYRAVSYMWGPPSPTRDITIEGRSFTIRDNLWHFLNSAHDFGDAWLWIDQICIDQETVKERNHQVNLMSKIYERAFEVLIWLGPEADGSSEGIAAINSGYAAIARHGRQVQALFERPYWNRLWIIQEVLLSQKSVVLCGDEAFDLRQLARMYVPNAGDSSVESTGYPVLISYWILTMIKYVFSSEKFEKQSLSSILSSFSMSQCEDTRDKVFGLLSLVQSSAAKAVDYSKTATEVYFDTIHQIVKNEIDRDFDDHVGVALILRDSMGLRIENSFIKSYINRECTNPGKRRGKSNTESLLLALQRSDTEAIQALGADSECVNGEDIHGRTLMMRAIIHKDKNTVEQLLVMCKPDVETQDIDGLTPLLRAIALGDLDMVDTLLTIGKANIEAKNTVGLTCLMLAILKGHESMVELLLKIGKPDLVARDRTGQTPLMQAVVRGEASIVKLLLSARKIDADLRDNNARVSDIDTVPPHVDMINAEVPACAQLYPFAKSETAMHFAAVSGRSDIVTMLLAEKNIEADKKTSSGWTPLMEAVRKGHKDIVDMLLSSGKVNINAEDGHGTTPLHDAVRSGRLSTLESLLADENIRVDVQDRYGMTPLMNAVIRGNKNMVNLLLGTGKVKIEAKDDYGMTAMKYADSLKNETIVELIRGYSNLS
jgi:ankyrin repeat protein